MVLSGRERSRRKTGGVLSGKRQVLILVLFLVVVHQASACPRLALGVMGTVALLIS